MTPSEVEMPELPWQILDKGIKRLKGHVYKIIM